MSTNWLSSSSTPWIWRTLEPRSAPEARTKPLGRTGNSSQSLSASIPSCQQSKHATTPAKWALCSPPFCSTSPRSAFAYVLAIIRIFREWKILLPPAKVVQGELHGLLRAFVTVYGAHALMPQRREPMRFTMVQALLSHPKDRLGARSYDPTSTIGWAFRGMLALGWRTGHRLAEFVAHPSNEVCYVTRQNVTYIIAGVPVADPTPAQLAALRPGDR